MTISVEGCRALVTGSNQGIGLGFVKVLLERGAAHVYATARRPETLEDLAALDPERVTTLTLDVTNAAQREAAAAVAGDINLLINNAGIPGDEDMKERQFLAAASLEDARQVMETDCFAQAEMVRALLPALEAQAPSAVINILSIGALFCLPSYASYCAAKSAAAIMTKGIRTELVHRNIFVAGVFTAGVDTRMAEKNQNEKISPVEHAHDVLDAVANGVEDIFAGIGADDARDAIRADDKAFERRQTERFYSNPLG